MTTQEGTKMGTTAKVKALYRRQQKRMSCMHCKAQWWWTPGGVIDSSDHSRPDGRRCRASEGSNV